MCVCGATDYTGETRCSLFLARLHPPLLSSASVCLRACSFSRPRFDGPSGATRSAPHADAVELFLVLRILSRAALGSKCIIHTHTHTHGAPLWIHGCSAKGFPMIKASLLLVQVLKKKKVETERRRRRPGGERGRFWSLRASSWQSRNVPPE